MDSDVFQAKGTSILTQLAFVKKNFGEQKYNEWIAALPSEVREIYEDTILASKWYTGKSIVIDTRRIICEMFYGGDPRGAWEVGQFAAEMGLGGIYKVFVKFGSPGWLAERAATIFSQYFKPGHIDVVSRDKTAAVMRLLDFPDETGFFEQTVGGFTEKALAISGAKNVVVKITKSYARGDEFAEFQGTWE